MTASGIWKAAAERILGGDRDEDGLVQSVLEAVEADPNLARALLMQLIRKRIRDMISNAVKGTGKTSRVPAGQRGFDWPGLDPAFAIAKLRSQIRKAAKDYQRAQVHAQILGIIDASEVDISACSTFGEVLALANVPAELVSALAA